METTAPAEGTFYSTKTNWIVGLLLAYFGLRLFWLATNISPYIPPDEVTHFGLCRVFSQVFLLPDNGPNTFQYGLVTNIPWLYYWIMGKLLHLNFLGLQDLTFLRLCNIPLAFGTLHFADRLLRQVTGDGLTRVLFAIALTNTMMFTFLSAFVSYDNLANLLAIMATHFLFRFFRERSGTLLALSWLCQLAGCLTKTTVLPLVLILNLVLLVREFRNLAQLPAGLSAFFAGKRPAALLLAGGLLAGLVLNLQLWGGNYLRYHTLAPEMTQVVPVENALQYRLVARNYIFSEFREGRLTQDQALAMTERINHPGDRADAQALIKNYQRFQAEGSPIMGLPSYAWLWIKRMAAGTYGIFGHRAIPNQWPTISPFALLGVLTLTGVALRWRPRDAQGVPALLGAIALGYALFLMCVVNYPDYRQTGAPYMALQGRYLFPVLGPAYAVGSCYLMRLFSGKGGRRAVFGLAAFIFVMCDFPFFMAVITPEWLG